VADPKTTLSVLPVADIQGKQSALLGEFPTDAHGNFTASFNGKYQGEAFEIDVYCGTVPHGPPQPPHGPVQFSVTTLQPQWRARGDVMLAGWELLPAGSFLVLHPRSVRRLGDLRPRYRLRH
jgi:hypothetical protein